MQMQISEETKESLYRDILFEDYLRLKESVSLFKGMDNIPKWQEEDYIANKRYLKALKVVMEYQVGFDWKQKVEEYKNASRA
jgi:hypothetical protein